MKLNRYLNNVHRYELSKGLQLHSDALERGLLSNCYAKCSKIVYSRRNNYAFKAFLGLVFVNYYFSRQYNKDKSTLQGVEVCECTERFGLFKRAAALFGAFALF